MAKRNRYSDMKMKNRAPFLKSNYEYKVLWLGRFTSNCLKMANTYVNICIRITLSLPRVSHSECLHIAVSDISPKPLVGGKRKKTERRVERLTKVAELRNLIFFILTFFWEWGGSWWMIYIIFKKSQRQKTFEE